MNADVLLFSLNHPDTFLAHLVHDSENVNDVVLSDSLQDSIQGYEGSAPSNASTAREYRSVKVEVKVFEDLESLVPPAVDDYWPLLGADAVPERSHEPVGQVGLDGHDGRNSLDFHEGHND